MSRKRVHPILNDVPASRQEAARHYGVHPYFTRRPSNVVRAYIDNYSEPGDVVLDPFGGSGVTAIEAVLLGRRAIHNDLNPFANFITAAIADTSLESTALLRQAFENVASKCREAVLKLEKADELAVESVLSGIALPKNIQLPRSSDAKCFYDLFSPRQLAGLGLIKESIEQEKDRSLRQLLLLAWSASVAKLNKTFLSAKGRTESRGGSSIFSIYRYKLASEPIELPIWETFQGRFSNVLTAKAEVLRIRDYYNNRSSPEKRIDSRKNLRILACDAASLVEELGEASVDYIFTDPPYGGHIAYLDLSILWNHWLGLNINEGASKEEAIVGGERRFSEKHYKDKLRSSIEQCMKLLRPNRWFSIVFQHWDVGYFQIILEGVRSKGGELVAAITHDKDVIWSMHKKKNAESVLSGEMLLTFLKPIKAIKKVRCASHPRTSLDELLDEFLLPLEGQTFRTESLFNRLVVAAWDRECLEKIAVDKESLVEALRSRGWHYDPARHVWDNQSRPARTELFSKAIS